MIKCRKPKESRDWRDVVSRYAQAQPAEEQPAEEAPIEAQPVGETPVANALAYNREAQPLVSAEAAWPFSIDGGIYSEEIPTAVCDGMSL